MCYNFLIKKAEYRIFMSATVGNKNAFDKNIGIYFTEQQTSNLEKIPSTFDFINSPIYVSNFTESNI